MIHPYVSSEKTQNALLHSLKTLKIAQLLRKSGIRKTQGASVFNVFRFLILSVFQGKNLYRFLESERKDHALSKNTYYRFLNDSTFAWRRFLSLLATRVTEGLDPLTKPKRVKVLVLDYTIIQRDRNKKVELLARVHDHTTDRHQKGFTMLALGWSDGYSFVPVDFSMLSSAKESNRIQNINENIDKRCIGYKRHAESMDKKPDVALKMIKNALNQGIMADYVLMDTWFTHEPFVMKIKQEGLDVIGDVKTFGKLFFQYCDDIRDMDLKTAMQSLMGLFVEQIKSVSQNKEIIKNQLLQWINQQASYIKALFADLGWES